MKACLIFVLLISVHSLIEPQFWKKHRTASKMKVFAVYFALVALTSAFKIEAKKTQLITRSEQCGPDETNCPGGCCPMPNWYCCPDSGSFCAATAADCPFEARTTQLVKMGKTNQCPGGTNCPGGCCPEAHWFCCDDVTVCAATAFDCPFEARKTQLVKMAKIKQCGPDETNCPGGCCPMPDWYCCPDASYCAATAADCPFEARKAQLMKMAKIKQCDPDETSCPGGCCPWTNWYCCPDAYYCAATAADCPFEAKKLF